MKFVHVADIHVGMSFADASFGYELGFQRREEIKESFMKLVDYCEENKIDLLLIAGDLFNEEKITSSELKDIQKKFGMLSKTTVAICAGNHDAIVGENSLYNMINWSPNVHIFGENVERLELEELGVDIYSFSWIHKEMEKLDHSEFKIVDESRINISMIHGDIYNESQYLPIKVSKLLKKGYDYIALGHIHKPDLSNEKYAYPGSLEPLSFKEVGPRGFIEGEMINGEIKKEFIEFSKRKFEVVKIEVNDELSFEEIKEKTIRKLEESVNKVDMVRVIYEGIVDSYVDLNIDALKRAIEMNIYYCEILDCTESNLDINRIKKKNQGNLIGEYIEYMEGKGLENPVVKEALYEGLKIFLSEKVSK